LTLLITGECPILVILLLLLLLLLLLFLVDIDDGGKAKLGKSIGLLLISSLLDAFKFPVVNKVTFNGNGKLIGDGMSVDEATSIEFSGVSGGDAI
jgi:hypothetical protein